MSERPDILLAMLLLTAAAAGGALVGAIADIGSHGVLGLAAVAAGVVTACFLFAFEIRHLPPAVLVTSLLAVSSSVSVARALARVWREQRLLSRLPRIPIEQSPYASFATEAGDVPIDVVHAASVNAFCAGIVRPRVIVTRGLLARLDEDELRAAVMHELEHARAHGPLKVALANVATRGLFWLPALGDLLDRFILVSELAADRAAIHATSRSALAGALSEVIDAPARPAGAVALADFAAPRIERLFDPGADLPPIMRRSSIVAGLAALGTVAFLLACSPHLGLGESAQLHSMSVHLLAQHLHARLLGLGQTAAVVAASITLRRRFATR